MIAACERMEDEKFAERTSLAPAHHLFGHIYSAKEFAAQFAKSAISAPMLAAGEAKLRAIVDDNLKRRAPNWDALRRHETAVYVAAGLIGLLRWWMANGFARTPAQMEAAFARLSESAVSEV